MARRRDGFPPLNKGIVSEEKQKPVLDEQTLAKLLEAAYVLQEHNREVREIELGLDLKRDQAEEQDRNEIPAAAERVNKPQQASIPGDYTFTLAQIVATQHQIQIRNLELDKAMALVAERLIEIAHADGAAIGMVDGRKVKYRAVAGAKALPQGTQVPSDKALCLPVIRNGQVFRCADVNVEFLVDTEECRRRGIQSLIAVPIFHEGGVAGGLELYYSAQNGFTDQDIHTCQLMAGLVTEALARDEEETWKQSLANERAMMLEALEKLKPNLSALMEPPPSSKETSARNPVPVPTAPTYDCKSCGHNLVGGEQFCGQCGTPRDGVVKPPITPHFPAGEIEKSKSATASMFHSTDHNRENPGSALSEESLPDSIEEEFPDLFGVPKTPVEMKPETKEAAVSAAEMGTNPDHDSEPSLHLQQEMETSPESRLEKSPVDEAKDSSEEKPDEEKKEPGAEELVLAKGALPANWNSAAQAREFLEQIAAGQQKSALARFWDARRGDIYLAIAIILVACVIRWGIWSNHPVSATTAPGNGAAAHRKTPSEKGAPDAGLSMFDRMLISLGLAEAPEVPEDKGNASTQVWVDVRTALYYCPGADSYGKTPKGKFMTQRDAQLDSYEPAFRKTCN